MENEPSSIFDEEFLTETTIRRRDLLSRPLKRYVWWILVLGSLGILRTMKELYRVIGDPDREEQVIGQALILASLVLWVLSSLLILREKKPGILLALIVAGISILLQLFNIGSVLLWPGDHLNPVISAIGITVISLALEIPYAIMLWKVRTKWEAIDR
ncbi:hypothetical protein FHW36_10964 [Chitinophaga polysaccharea]|uniref:Uncharacterized protein n=1 Tax=Chitinophaga polysaccharea TaxID=1293035 RepID=A0A561PAX5_9BACT|nr:hypothetical protein [Chitinophaga polysaccharea]TWF35277.1 hypothetical protein FHW36_10964 [Chitinophaga polysaccharea]